jgi:hypothetical protein
LKERKRERQKWWEDEEEDVRSYWITICKYDNKHLVPHMVRNIFSKLIIIASEGRLKSK